MGCTRYVFVFKLVSWALNERDGCKFITEKFRELLLSLMLATSSDRLKVQ